MNACASENYPAISRSSSATKSVEIFWAEIYWGQLFLGPNLVSFNQAVVPLFESLSRTSDTTETRNPCVIKVILLACFTYIDIF
jgi:hypothetical protein